jgi:hypothetical protein
MTRCILVAAGLFLSGCAHHRQALMEERVNRKIMEERIERKLLEERMERKRLEDRVSHQERPAALEVSRRTR